MAPGAVVGPSSVAEHFRSELGANDEGVDAALTSQAIKQAHLDVLSRLLRVLMSSLELRAQAQRRAQLCEEIEGLARRCGWQASEELARLLRRFLAAVPESQYGEAPSAIALALTCAAQRPHENWRQVVSQTRDLIEALAQRPSSNG
jgi:hypothetical protein